MSRDHNVRYWHKADIPSCAAHVCFRGQSGHGFLRRKCLLLTQSGHRPASYGAVAKPVRSLSKYSFKPIRCCLLGFGMDMRRREFLGVLGGAAASWPFAVGAQQPERLRRIGVLMNLAENQQAQARISALRQALEQFGWTDHRNVQIEIRWAAGDADRYRKFAAELTALVPDVILATGTPAVEALQRATRTIPIVFVAVVDPVGAGLVANLARPGGNTTGFSLYEYGQSGKSLELLKQIAPPVTRVAVLRIRQSRRNRSVGRHPNRRAIARSRTQSGRPARSGRDRACHY